MLFNLLYTRKELDKIRSIDKERFKMLIDGLYVNIVNNMELNLIEVKELSSIFSEYKTDLNKVL